MSSQFIQRIANYIANEVLIKGLANSKIFQRFAVRTDAQLKTIQKAGEEQFNEAVQGMTSRAASTSAGSAMSGPPQPPLTGFQGFVSAFFKEIRKDLGIGK